MGDIVQERGLITIHKCVAIRHAKSAERMGVDIISLDGFEVRWASWEDDIGNFVLQAKGAKVLKTPFVCSGVSAMASSWQPPSLRRRRRELVDAVLRYAGMQLLLFQRAPRRGDERSSALIFRQLHNTARVFKNKVAKEVVEISEAKGRDLEFGDAMHLVMGARGREAEKNGDPDGGIWTAGQVTGLIDDFPSCATVMDRIITEAEDTIRARLSSMIVSKL